MRPNATDYLNEDEFWNDVYEYEMGYQGDPRRCPRHPQVVTSSPDGMHDAPCRICEAEMDQEHFETREHWTAPEPIVDANGDLIF